MKKIFLFAALATVVACACAQPKPAFETDNFATASGQTLRIHALMHASILIEYNGHAIYIDPVGKLGSRTISYAQLPKADYIFVTHEHADHFDKQTIASISGENTRIITNKRCAEMLGHATALVNGESLDIAPWISVEAVPAYNTTPGREQFHPKGRDNGYIMVIDGLRIYIAGDTENIPEMANVKDIYVAFLPCNQPYTMTVEQLLDAAKTIQPKVLFPYHYGQTDVSPIPNSLKNSGIDVRIRHYE